MSWLATNWPTLAIGVGSLIINALALVISVRMHCRNDDRKFGAIEERSERNERRLANLERMR